MKKSLSIVSALMLMSVGNAHAQTATVVRSGELTDRVADRARERTEQADRDAQQKLDGPTVVTAPVNRAELPAAGGATVLLKSIVFKGNSVFITDEELEAIAAKYRGRRVDFRDISSLIRDINDIYAEKKIVTAAAVLPPQDLSTGELTVQLVEGQLGNVAVVGKNRTRSDYILRRIRLAHGTTVDTPTASKDINFFNKTSKAQMRMLLRPGEQFGFTDIVLGLVEPAPHQLNVILDNEGVESTGEVQGSVIYQNYGAFGIDDTFLLYGSRSKGAGAISARYDMPISRYGTRLNVSGTLSSIQVISGAAKILNIKGESKSVDANVSQPFFVNDDWVISAVGGVFFSDNATRAGSVSLVDSSTRKHNAGVTAQFSNEKAVLSMQAKYVEAEVHDHLASSSEKIALGTGSLYGAYGFEDGKTSISVIAAGQYTNDELVPGNLLFSIGGANTVRGYPSDGVAGDSGYFANFELSHRLPTKKVTTTAFAFFDYGRVFSTFPESITLASVGGGVEFGINERATVRFTGAVPIRDTLDDQSRFTAYVSLNMRLH